MAYGMFYTMVDGQATRQLERNPPASSVISLAANQDANSSGADAIRIADLFPAHGALAARPQVWSDIGRRPLPYVQQWNLSVQQSLAGDMVLEVSYMGSKGTHMPSYAQGNQATLDANPSRPTSLISRQPFPLWGSELRTTVLSDSTYHAGFIKMERRLTRGFSLLAHYTFSKSLDAGSDINQSLSDFYNLRSSKGRSLSDIRHYAVVASTWEPPVGPGKRFLTAGILSQILGSWKANSIISIRGGFPYSPGVQGDVCNCSAYSQRPDLVGDPRSGFSQRREKWFNTAAFVTQAAGTLGNAGRDILSGPGSTTVSFSLFRIINIKEKARLQFRTEFFNLFNKTNFGNPGGAVGSTNYGVITSAAAARVVQFALKLQF